MFKYNMGNKLVNIILSIIVFIMIILDALAIHDIISDEPDLLYEIGMLSVSILVFIAIGVYLKQRKQKSSQA